MNRSFSVFVFLAHSSFCDMYVLHLFSLFFFQLVVNPLRIGMLPWACRTSKTLYVKTGTGVSVTDLCHVYPAFKSKSIIFPLNTSFSFTIKPLSKHHHAPTWHSVEQHFHWEPSLEIRAYCQYLSAFVSMFLTFQQMAPTVHGAIQITIKHPWIIQFLQAYLVGTDVWLKRKE